MIGRFGGGPVNPTTNEGLVFVFLILPSIAILFGSGSFFGVFLYLFMICGSAVAYGLLKKRRASRDFENFTDRSFRLTNKRVTHLSIASVVDQYYIGKVDYIGETIRLHLKKISSIDKENSIDMVQTVTRGNFEDLKVSETHLTCRFNSISIGVDLTKDYK
ncbi:hypothetical protein [Paenibacillus xylanexedens]|uniref:hypothetical protein n=1 Tax=Paenibacillus xylanexedens TaxID=528191 RepID=UPI000F52DC4A|nr:hypothetical protein [Paenibacillus xylanexedens]